MRRILFFGICTVALATCEVPVGRDGQYGFVFVGYRLPDLSQPPPDSHTLGDK